MVLRAPKYSPLFRTILLLLLFSGRPTSLLRAQQAVLLPDSVLLFDEPGMQRLHPDTASIMRSVDSAFAWQDSAPDKAMHLLRKTITESSRIGFDEGIVRSLVIMSLIYQNKQQHKQSLLINLFVIRYYELAAAQKKKVPLRGLVSAHTNAANTYTNMGNYGQAAHHFDLALQTAEQRPELEELLARVYTNYAAMLLELNEPERALLYLQKGEQVLRRKGNYKALAMLLVNKGAALAMSHRYQECSMAYNEALELGRAHNVLKAQLLTLQHLASLNIEHKSPQKAIPYLEEAIRIRQRSEYKNDGLQETRFLLAQAYEGMGQPQKAVTYLEQIVRDTVPTVHRTMMFAHALMSKTYGQTGDYHNAWLHEKLHSRLRDSVFDEKQMQQLDELEVKYRTLQKDKQITEERLVITRQQANIRSKNFWIWGTTAAALLLVSMLGLLYRSYRHRRRLDQEKLRALRQEKEIELLKAMIQGEEKERNRLARELHDGISSQLAAVKLYLDAAGHHHPPINANADFGQARQLLQETAEDIRKTAHNLMPAVLLDNDLPEALQGFCTYLTRKNDLKIEFQAYGDFNKLNNERKLSVYRIVQELLQNVVKHAQATQAIVLLNLQDGQLHITVEDNGVGMNTDQAAKGIGLASLASRVQALNGGMTLESVPGSGTVVSIEIVF